MKLDNFKFKKVYGQNFLKDDNIVRKIVDVADIDDQSLVIEVGPGSGMLTKQLCPRAKQVLSYEIDSSLEDILIKNLKNYENLEIIFDDFMKRDLKSDISKYSYNKLYVVANLPYYITTPIINKIIDSNLDLNKMVLMVQKEVGDRFAANTNSSEYGSITVYLNYYFNVKKEFLVDRANFIPMPNVDSIIISLTKKDKRQICDNEEIFFTLVRDSFKFKRKNIRNNLKSYDLNLVEKVLKKFDLDLTSRAEQIPLEVFIELSNEISKNK